MKLNEYWHCTNSNHINIDSNIVMTLKEYEKHAGRYRDGDVKPFNFYTDSKQRLRSALGKSADFFYIDDKDQPDVRIYRVVQRTREYLTHSHIHAQRLAATYFYLLL